VPETIVPSQCIFKRGRRILSLIRFTKLRAAGLIHAPVMQHKQEAQKFPGLS
jgi:hypothetical protein